MPRIPMYERQVDGAVGSRVNYAEISPDAFGAGIGRALERGGAMVGQALQQRQARQDAAAEDAERIAATRAIAQLQADTLADTSEARTKIAADGTGHAEAVTGRFDARASAALETIRSPRVRAWAEAQVIERRGRVLTGEMEYAAGQSAAKVVGDFAAARKIAEGTLFADGDEKLFEMTLGSQVSAIESMTALPPDKKAELKADTVARLSEAYARGLRERDPYRLRAMIDDGAFTGLLDLQDLASIRNGADTEIRGREAAARQEENQRRAEARAAAAEQRRAQADAERAAIDNIRDAADAAAAGAYLAPGDYAALAGQAERLGNRGLARRVAVLGEQNATIGALRGARPVEVQTVINGLTAELAEGGANAPVIKARLDAAEAFKRKQDAELRTDPLSYATTQGVVALGPLDVTDVNSLVKRGQDARAVQARYGGPLMVLTNEEAGELHSRLWGGNAQSRLQALTEIQRMGPTGAAAAMRQISKGRPVEARVGALMATPGGVQTARTILIGMDVMKASPKVVSREETHAVAREHIGRALRYLPSDMVGTTADTAGAYYVGTLTATGGEVEWDSDEFKPALNVALGGVTGSDGVQRGGIGKYKGWKTLLPDGMSEDGLANALGNLTVAKLPEAQRPVWGDGSFVSDEQLRKMRAFAVGNGRYVLTADADGEQMLFRKDRTRFEVRVRSAASGRGGVPVAANSGRGE